MALWSLHDSNKGHGRRSAPSMGECLFRDERFGQEDALPSAEFRRPDPKNCGSKFVVREDDLDFSDGTGYSRKPEAIYMKRNVDEFGWSLNWNGGGGGDGTTKEGNQNKNIPGD